MTTNPAEKHYSDPVLYSSELGAGKGHPDPCRSSTTAGWRSSLQEGLNSNKKIMQIRWRSFPFKREGASIN
jgi:hypothetical protein